MNGTDQLKRDMSAVQSMLIKPITDIGKLVGVNSRGDVAVGDLMDDIMRQIENACIEARNTIEYYRPKQEGGPKQQNSAERALYGKVERMPQGWLHIQLDALLPHCKYGTSQYLKDSILRLLKQYQQKHGRLPRFERALLVIDEHCSYANRQVYDPDNKGWKSVVNALKGVVYPDDDQFHLSIYLTATPAEVPSCHIYVADAEDTAKFMVWYDKHQLRTVQNSNFSTLPDRPAK